MDFTHINVSKYNYCFSDHSFPADSVDYPHHSEMYKYVKSYTEKHQLYEQIEFRTRVTLVQGFLLSLNFDQVNKDLTQL